jgi:hypothetical protein
MKELHGWVAVGGSIPPPLLINHKHGKYKAEGKFGEYLESLIIGKAEKQL